MIPKSLSFNVTGDSEYCSPVCGKTVRGVDCHDECETRGYQYYWCNIGSTWDYCSRTSCPIRVPYSYQDCSAEMVHKTAWFEYLYYPDYWLAKGYENSMAALWKPKNGINGNELFCPEEGYGWFVHEAPDGSVYLESTRHEYKNYFLRGYAKSELGIEVHSHLDDDGDIIDEVDDNTKVYNMGYARDIEGGRQYHEAFAFRVMCQSCSTKQKCILWRLHDEFKLYSDSLGYLSMCKRCGSNEWFNWRVHVPDYVNFTCSRSAEAISYMFLMRCILNIVTVICFTRFYTATHFTPGVCWQS